LYALLPSFFYTHPPPTEIYTLSLHDALPISDTARALEAEARERLLREADDAIYNRRNNAVEQERKIRENELNTEVAVQTKQREIDRKSTRLNSSHVSISYAVFCLKKKKIMI